MSPPSAVGLSLASALVAHADEVRFAGQSRATPQLKVDVLGMVAGYSAQRYKCGTITAVNSTILPKSYSPRIPLHQIASPDHVYERWVIDLCEVKRAFLVGLWPDPKGGANFKVVEIRDGVEP